MDLHCSAVTTPPVAVDSTTLGGAFSLSELVEEATDGGAGDITLEGGRPLSTQFIAAVSSVCSGETLEEWEET
jgi:hypothetical protein